MADFPDARFNPRELAIEFLAAACDGCVGGTIHIVHVSFKGWKNTSDIGFVNRFWVQGKIRSNAESAEALSVQSPCGDSQSFTQCLCIMDDKFLAQKVQFVCVCAEGVAIDAMRTTGSTLI